MDCVFYVHSVLSPHNYSLRPGHWPKRTKLNQEWLSVHRTPEAELLLRPQLCTSHSDVVPSQAKRGFEFGFEVSLTCGTVLYSDFHSGSPVSCQQIYRPWKASNSEPDRPRLKLQLAGLPKAHFPL